jgi:hypothetical protein
MVVSLVHHGRLNSEATLAGLVYQRERVEDDGSASNGYELTGLPDGLGAVADGTDFALLMNPEIDAGAGGVRRHGQRGAYVSTFTIDRVSFEVKEGWDTIDPGGRYWNYLTREYQATASPDGRNPRKRGDDFQAQGDTLVHLCSGPLSAARQFVSGERGSGYSGQIYFANEELDPDGRVFGVLPDGETQQLPRLGLFAHENTKPAYNRSQTTLAIGTRTPPGRCTSMRAPSRPTATRSSARGSPTGPVKYSTWSTRTCPPTATSAASTARAGRSSSTSPRSTGTSPDPVRTHKPKRRG